MLGRLNDELDSTRNQLVASSAKNGKLSQAVHSFLSIFQIVLYCIIK